MSLTSAQLATLKADIAADPVLGTLPQTPDNAILIAQTYSEIVAPAFVVYRTSVNAEEWRQAILGGGGAPQLDALTASKRDSLLWAVNDVLNPALAAVRVALDDFCGSQNTLKAAIQAAQKRSANRVEKLFATGTGTTASPATMGFEGTLSMQDVQDAWGA